MCRRQSRRGLSLHSRKQSVRDMGRQLSDENFAARHAPQRFFVCTGSCDVGLSTIDSTELTNRGPMRPATLRDDIDGGRVRPMLDGKVRRRDVPPELLSVATHSWSRDQDRRPSWVL